VAPFRRRRGRRYNFPAIAPTARHLNAEDLAMPAYANTSGTSPIEWYDIELDGDAPAIEIRFRRTRRRRATTYRYEGAVAVTLIELALVGQGLATYIAREKPSHVARFIG
jgi:hypothetical protein